MLRTSKGRVGFARKVLASTMSCVMAMAFMVPAAALAGTGPMSGSYEDEEGTQYARVSIWTYADDAEDEVDSSRETILYTGNPEEKTGTENGAAYNKQTNTLTSRRRTPAFPAMQPTSNPRQSCPAHRNKIATRFYAKAILLPAAKNTPPTSRYG